MWSVDDEESKSVDVEMGSYVEDEFCVGDQSVCVDEEKPEGQWNWRNESFDFDGVGDGLC